MCIRMSLYHTCVQRGQKKVSCILLYYSLTIPLRQGLFLSLGLTFSQWGRKSASPSNPQESLCTPRSQNLGVHRVPARNIHTQDFPGRTRSKLRGPLAHIQYSTCRNSAHRTLIWWGICLPHNVGTLWNQRRQPDTTDGGGWDENNQFFTAHSKMAFVNTPSFLPVVTGEPMVMLGLSLRARHNHT